MADFIQKKIRTDAEWLAAGNRDRRAKGRRDGSDRREMIRFDLKLGERRNYQDRRSNANAWQNDHTF
jgi:hypothetical protein